MILARKVTVWGILFILAATFFFPILEQNMFGGG